MIPSKTSWRTSTWCHRAITMLCESKHHMDEDFTSDVGNADKLLWWSHEWNLNSSNAVDRGKSAPFLGAVFAKLIWILHKRETYVPVEVLGRVIHLQHQICRLAHKHTCNCINLYKKNTSLSISFLLLKSREKYHCTNNILILIAAH